MHPGHVARRRLRAIRGRPFRHKADDESAEDAGKEKLSIKPRGKAKRKLNAEGKAKMEANVTYTPDGGAPNTEDKKIKLKKR